MKIAGISMTYNDGYKLKEWTEHYRQYKDELDYYIIVDNGSDVEYISQLETVFSCATILKRNSNGGCTAAYNDGIKFALEHTDADAIVIIANDFNVKKGCFQIMYNYLYSDKNLGIVSTAVLSGNSGIVDNYGHKISGYKIIELEKGKKITDLTPIRKYTDLVTGGFYMAKRIFYENVGFQDENLFMYGDEFDTSIRAKKAGYKIGVTCESYSCHCHINEAGAKERKPAAVYLIARNRIYISRKYFGLRMILGSFWYFSLRQAIIFVLSGIIKKKSYKFLQAKYAVLGGGNGLRGNMELNKYTKF